MELLPSHVEGYLELIYPEDGLKRREERSAGIRARLASGAAQADSILVRVNAAGRVIASLRLEPLGPTTRFLHRLYMRANAGPQELREALGLIVEAHQVSLAAGATKLATRVRDDLITPEYAAALRIAGFSIFERRVEFTAQLSTAPSDSDSPFSWRSMSEVPRATVLALLEDVLRSQPRASATASAHDALKDYLSSPDQTTGPECVQVGFIAEEPAAIVIAQVLPATGWGTLAEMGLAKGYRGRGLGALVQRHGFAMLRSQGGTHYRDGTSEENAQMLAIFRRNGCVEHSRMTEWRAGEW